MYEMLEYQGGNSIEFFSPPKDGLDSWVPPPSLSFVCLSVCPPTKEREGGRHPTLGCRPSLGDQKNSIKLPPSHRSPTLPFIVLLEAQKFFEGLLAALFSQNLMRYLVLVTKVAPFPSPHQKSVVKIISGMDFASTFKGLAT